MICRFCNNEIDDLARECPHCGTRYKTKAEERAEKEVQAREEAKAAKEQAALEAAEREAAEQVLAAVSETVLTTTEPVAEEAVAEPVAFAEEVTAVSSEADMLPADEIVSEEAAGLEEATFDESASESVLEETADETWAAEPQAEAMPVEPSQLSEEKQALMDEMPEIHDELDRIGEMRERRRKRRWRILFFMLFLIVCAVGAWFGFRYFNPTNQNSQATEAPAEEVVQPVGVAAEPIEKLYGAGAVSKLVDNTDEKTAKAAIDTMKSTFGVQTPGMDFSLANKTVVGDVTYYRFAQTYQGVKVYGSEIVMAVAGSGEVIGLNGNVVAFETIDIKAQLEHGSAVNAISEYVNKMPKEYCITAGASVAKADKVLYYNEGKVYLCYRANVSGYNADGMYVAYDAFVDANRGVGVGICHTADFENEGVATPEGVPAAPAEGEAAEPVAEVPPEPEVLLPDLSAVDSRMKMFMVNDKFNWNDSAKSQAVAEIDLSGTVETSAYVTEMKRAANGAYVYFRDRFGYRGLDGANSEYLVYLNPNAYVAEGMPPEKAVSVRNILMFIQENSANTLPDANVVAHEYVHGVLRNTSGFGGTVTLDENAAISEGVADAFAELTEYYVTGGKADWVHGNRNLAQPGNGYVAVYPQKMEFRSVDDCYCYSTIISHAVCKMVQDGVAEEAVSEWLFKTVCMLDGQSDFSEFRALAELMANHMYKNGRLGENQYQIVMKALADTNIPVAQQLYATQQETLGEPEVLPEEPVDVATPESPVTEPPVAETPVTAPAVTSEE